MSTSLATRYKLAEVFGFKKVHSTHVSNNEVVDDGFNIKDIEDALTVEKMQNYTSSTEADMNVLFGQTVDKAEGRLPEPIKEDLIGDKIIADTLDAGFVTHFTDPNEIMIKPKKKYVYKAKKSK